MNFSPSTNNCFAARLSGPGSTSRFCLTSCPSSPENLNPGRTRYDRQASSKNQGTPAIERVCRSRLTVLFEQPSSAARVLASQRPLPMIRCSIWSRHRSLSSLPRPSGRSGRPQCVLHQTPTALRGTLVKSFTVRCASFRIRAVCRFSYPYEAKIENSGDAVRNGRT